MSATSDSTDDAAALPLRRAEHRSLPQIVADQLVKLIAASGMPELKLPPERDLCVQLDVGRNVVREAMSFLEGIGVVETRRRERIGRTSRARAHLVAAAPRAASDRALLTDPIEVRKMLEPECAAFAARRRTDDELAEIERWLDAMDRGAARGDRVTDFDAAFHVAVARATNNDTLLQLVSTLVDVVHASREKSFEPAHAADAAIADHRAIFEAIKLQDAEQAHRAMHDHISRVEELIHYALNQDRSNR